ncbi:MAG: hypothetical protein ACOX4U_06525 [Anaerovoracaceae bacterium]|jgi:hypothetical protein
MGKIKDIIYDKNDILIAFIIISIAALIIYSRIVVIMDYPAVLAAEADANAHNAEQYYDDGEDEDEDDPSIQMRDEDFNDEDSSKSKNPSNEEIADTGQAPKGILLEIPIGANMNQIGQIFVDAGLAYDVDEFLDAVVEAGVETKIKAGSFNFPSDTTLKQAVVLVAK